METDWKMIFDVLEPFSVFTCEIEDDLITIENLFVSFTLLRKKTDLSFEDWKYICDKTLSKSSDSF